MTKPMSLDEIREAVTRLRKYADRPRDRDIESDRMTEDAICESVVRMVASADPDATEAAILADAMLRLDLERWYA